MSTEILGKFFKYINVVGPNDKVLKDECICSFETAESKGGLYISMDKFEAVSEDFLDYYFERYSAPVYLHHKKIKFKIDKQETFESKPKRLAIGLEGGFDPDAADKDFKYEDTYSIVILPTGEKFPLPDPNLPELVLQSVESIISAESGENVREQTTSFWDGEQRKVSKFSDKLEQLVPARKIPPSGWKCDKCDLTENLWLNLTDGSILCGRRFYDGSGGNNHAVEHYDECKYPLAVKLGTITASGADVYSYPEEDMVLDPNLDKHLAHFGIDIQKMIKTEKSILELEIDINERLGEWSVIQEEGKNLEPVSGPGFTGLTNLGNSCYMNSVLQVLFSIEEFQKRYFPPTEIYNLSEGAKSFNHQMAKLAYGLLSGKYSDIDQITKNQKGINPKSFKNFVCGMDRNFGAKRQQDAHEFFLFIMDLVGRNARECRYIPNYTPSDNVTSDPTKCLEFVIEDRIQCSESKKVRYTNRVESCLPLHVDLDLALNMDEVQEAKKAEADSTATTGKVRPKIKLMSCIDSFSRTETLTGFFSNAVKKRVNAHKSSKISRFPRLFVFQMKKFQCGSDWVPKKMDVAFEVPDILDLEFLEGRGLQPGEEELEDSGETTPTSAQYGITGESSGSSAPSIEPDSEAVAMLLSMGIDVTQAIIALKVCNNDTQRAIEYIFDPESVNAQQLAQDFERDESRLTVATRPDPLKMKLFIPDEKPKLYQLKAFISHMGTTPNCGHYVCHIKKDERWYIFNDNKVALSENPPKELGYLYFYERIQ